MIIVDSRELANRDGQLVYEKLGKPETTLLAHGDYLIRGHDITVLVERVTATGLLADIESGRMKEKLEGCAEDSDIAMLVVERLIFPSRDNLTLVQEGGYTFDYYDTKGGERANLRLGFYHVNWHYHSIAEFLTSVSLRYIDKIEFTLSPTWTAARLLQLDRYFNKSPDNHLLHLTRSRPFTMRLHENTPEYILSGLPGVGIERARALLNVYGNVLNVAMADVNALSKIEGIGKITARKIHEAFRQEYGTH